MGRRQNRIVGQGCDVVYKPFWDSRLKIVFSCEVYTHFFLKENNFWTKRGKYYLAIVQDGDHKPYYVGLWNKESMYWCICVPLSLNAKLIKKCGDTDRDKRSLLWLINGTYDLAYTLRFQDISFSKVFKCEYQKIMHKLEMNTSAVSLCDNDENIDDDELQGYAASEDTSTTIPIYRKTPTMKKYSKTASRQTNEPHSTELKTLNQTEIKLESSLQEWNPFPRTGIPQEAFSRYDHSMKYFISTLEYATVYPRHFERLVLRW